MPIEATDTPTHQAPTETGTRPDKIRSVARPPMIKKTYYVPVKLYDAVVAKSDEQEETVADVIRRAFEEYVKDDKS